MAEDGAALCARFSLATNRLQYCGPNDAEGPLYRAIVEGTDLDRARDALRRFEALYPYLAAIGERHQLDPFDAQVVEAYWIGNRLLDDFGRERFIALLHTLGRRGLPPRTVDRLVAHLPERPLPHHAFHVAYVGVGEVTGHVPTTLANLEACRPAPARVTRCLPGELEVERRPLVVDGGRLELGPPTRERRPFDPRIVPEPRVGDWVALHWGHPALLLHEAQRAALEEYTRRSIAAANEALPALRTLR